MQQRGVMCVFHYIPLHTSPAGLRFGRFCGEDVYTTRERERLMRLPMFYNLSMEDVEYIVKCLLEYDEY
jgi:dTDP-4-amino-4,6-dideoxygalactose transaminase